MPEGSLAGRALGPEWRVLAHDAEQLVLERHATGEGRRAAGTLVVALASLAMGLALALATPEALRLVTWPVSGLLLLVAGLGVPAALRRLQRARRGVRLAIDGAGAVGWPVSFALAPRRLRASEVAEVAVRRFAHPPLTLVLLEVVARDGARLEGPELAVPEGAPHPLDDVAAAARRLIRLNPRG